MRDYIDGGSGEFYDIVDRYRYSLSYENLDKTRDGNAYSINVDNFGVFYKLFSEESNDEKYYNPFNIIKYVSCITENRYMIDILMCLIV